MDEYNFSILLDIQVPTSVDEIDFSSFVWGTIKLEVQDKTNIVFVKTIEGDILSLAIWFLENMKYIMTDKFNMFGNIPSDDESIAEALYRIRIETFSISLDDDNDIRNPVLDELAIVYESYYDQHSVRSALFGPDVPDIIIGRRNTGIGEVSLLSKSENWKYPFNMDIFIHQFKGEMQRCISKWLENENIIPAVRERGVTVINDFQNLS